MKKIQNIYEFEVFNYFVFKLTYITIYCHLCPFHG
jgi:hypothetical protein